MCLCVEYVYVLCACVWSSENNLGHCSSSTVYLSLLRYGLSLTWIVDWLATETQASAYPYLPSAEIISGPHRTWLFVSSEDGIRSLCLDGKHFGNWASLFQSELYSEGSNVLSKHIPQKRSHFVSLHTLALGVENGFCLFCIFSSASPPGVQTQLCKQGYCSLPQGREVILSIVRSVESVRTAGRAWPPSEVWVTSQYWFNKMSGWLSEHEYERMLFWPPAFSSIPPDSWLEALMMEGGCCTFWPSALCWGWGQGQYQCQDKILCAY